MAIVSNEPRQVTVATFKPHSINHYVSICIISKGFQHLEKRLEDGRFEARQFIFGQNDEGAIAVSVSFKGAWRDGRH